MCWKSFVACVKSKCQTRSYQMLKLSWSPSAVSKLMTAQNKFRTQLIRWWTNPVETIVVLPKVFDDTVSDELNISYILRFGVILTLLVVLDRALARTIDTFILSNSHRKIWNTITTFTRKICTTQNQLSYNKH